MEHAGKRLRDVVQAVGAVEERNVVVAHVVEDERERDQDHRQVVGLQPAQGEQGDQGSQGRRGEAAQEEVDGEGQPEAEDVVLAAIGRARQGQRAGHVGAGRHEADVGEVQDPRLAVLDVQPHGEDEVVEEKEDEGEHVVSHVVMPFRVARTGRSA